MNEREFLPVFGKRLRDLRQAKGLTQERLASDAGFDRTYVSLVERGKRNLSLLNMMRFARALGVTVADLCRGIGDVPGRMRR